MARHNDIGQWGEQIAREILVTKGYAIVGYNIKVGHHEVDIIATKGDRMAFVEVKTRSNEFDDPTNAIDHKRMVRMASAANSYIRNNKLPYAPQLDVIAITGTPDHYTVEHFEDAFMPPLRTR